MTRSDFDPTGNSADRGRGNRFLGDPGVGHSHLPASVQPETSEEKSLDGQREAETVEEAVAGLEALEKMTPEEVDAETLSGDETEGKAEAEEK